MESILQNKVTESVVKLNVPEQSLVDSSQIPINLSCDEGMYDSYYPPIEEMCEKLKKAYGCENKPYKYDSIVEYTARQIIKQPLDGGMEINDEEFETLKGDDFSQFSYGLNQLLCNEFSIQGNGSVDTISITNVLDLCKVTFVKDPKPDDCIQKHQSLLRCEFKEAIGFHPKSWVVINTGLAANVKKLRTVTVTPWTLKGGNGQFVYFTSTVLDGTDSGLIHIYGVVDDCNGYFELNTIDIVFTSVICNKNVKVEFDDRHMLVQGKGLINPYSTIWNVGVLPISDEFKSIRTKDGATGVSLIGPTFINETSVGGGSKMMTVTQLGKTRRRSQLIFIQRKRAFTLGNIIFPGCLHAVDEEDGVTRLNRVKIFSHDSKNDDALLCAFNGCGINNTKIVIEDQVKGDFRKGVMNGSFFPFCSDYSMNKGLVKLAGYLRTMGVIEKIESSRIAELVAEKKENEWTEVDTAAVQYIHNWTDFMDKARSILYINKESVTMYSQFIEVEDYNLTTAQVASICQYEAPYKPSLSESIRGVVKEFTDALAIETKK